MDTIQPVELIDIDIFCKIYSQLDAMVGLPLPDSI